MTFLLHEYLHIPPGLCLAHTARSHVTHSHSGDLHKEQEYKKDSQSKTRNMLQLFAISNKLGNIFYVGRLLLVEFDMIIAVPNHKHTPSH